jgi:SAM-dependent methyltransferase
MTPTKGSVLQPDDPGYDGQRHYTSRFLRIYDLLVIGFFTRVVWRCPPQHIASLYARYTGRRHLDVGPGTGYFLSRAPSTERLLLLDPNLAVLTYAARQLADRAPATLAADIRATIPVEERFDSAALSLVLHCLPGPMEAKAAAVENVAAVLDPGGVLFGATVLGDRRLHNRFSAFWLRENNRRGIFDNLGDTEAGLRSILTASFEEVEVRVIGSAALFAARKGG